MISTIRFSLVALLLTGCVQTQYIHEPTPLPVPPRPELAPVSGSDLQCLSDQTYITLVNREQAYKRWGLKMEAIIKANNSHVSDNHD